MANIGVAVRVLKKERADRLDNIDARRQEIQHWYAKRDECDEELKKLIKQFNEIIQDRKEVTKNLALDQHLLNVDYVYLEDLDKAIKTLENLI